MAKLFQQNQTIDASDLTGYMMCTVARTLPTPWFACDGSAISRASNTGLFNVLCPSSTVTMTIASPAVITWTGHQLVNGDIVVFTTTGALPTGLTAGTQYYVVSSATNTFRVAATKNGAAINTSGSQSGTHTAQCFTFGVGDGSTTFNLPDLRGRAVIGVGTGSKAISLPAIAISSNQITVNASSDIQQGMAVLYTGSGITGLTTSTTYYVIIVSSTLISLAASQSDANAGTVITISGTPSSASLTYSLTARNIGDTGGEENHAISKNEMASHRHTLRRTSYNTSPGGSSSAGWTSTGLGGSVNDNTLYDNFNSQGQALGDTGGDAQHNNMPPFLALYWYIHA